MKYRMRFVLAVPALAAAALAATATINTGKYLDDVRFLASRELRGRGTGSPELEKAARYIAGQFRALGLQPLDAKGFFQPFPVTTQAKLGKNNRFAFAAGGARAELKLQEEFVPFNFSASGKLEGQVVFAGYGITAREYNYDDYAGLDVKDKIVLLLRHEPQEFDEKSVFAGRIFTEHAQFASKATNARNHGARGVILVNDRANHKGESDELEKFGVTAGPGEAGIPYVQVKAEVVERWLQATGKNLEETQAAIDTDLQPRSFPLPESVRIEAQLDLLREVRTVHNVAGYLPGQTDEYVVIGAHYDHLGMGEQFSMAPSEAGKAVHPGADDNASGTAGVLELARWFTKQPKPRRGILFLTFAGEELGLLGSSHYVNHPALPLEKAVAMINMDMIGRIRDGKVYVGGLGSGTTLKALVEEIVARYDLKIDYSDTSGYGSSDHTSFTTKQVPVLFFFSGLHGDYHKPSDTPDKIEAGPTARLLQLIAEVSDKLIETAARPMFVRVAEPARATGSVGGAKGYGAYFGSIPDFGQTTNGVKFADVRDGSPAAQAGLKGGDVMVEFDGKKIQNLYDFTYALQARKPGEEVAVKVLRDGKPLEVRVVLGQRK